MPKKRHVHPSDIQALAQLATDATIGLTDLVESVHSGISPVSRVTGQADSDRTSGITGLVYKAVRGVARAAGNAAEALLGQLAPLFDEAGSSPEREAVLAALNGVLGDYMAASGNALAIKMQFRKEGHPLELSPEVLAAAFPQDSRKLVVLVHGLCMNDLQWHRQGHDHGAALARDLGYTPLYLHYNSGLHISTNGRAFGELLETLVQNWPQPIDELAIVCHSMGGLVTRCAYHTSMEAGRTWPQHVRKLVFLGTPHHGAPLERIGNWIDTILQAMPYASPFARLGKVRSAGITDLRHGNVLDEDWEGRDRFARAPDRRRSLPLPVGPASYAVAATLGKKTGDLGDRLLGDGLVPIGSALGRHRNLERRLAFTPEQQWLGVGMGHMDLLSHADVYERIRTWLSE